MITINKSKKNCLAIVLLVAAFLAFFMPLTMVTGHAEEYGKVVELLIPQDADDPIRLVATQGVWTIEILDYKSKYLDSLVDDPTNNLTFRNYLFGDPAKPGSDDVLEIAPLCPSITIAGDLDDTMFDFLNQFVAANAAANGSTNHTPLTKIVLSTTKDIPQSAIDYLKSWAVTPEIKLLLGGIDFDITIPNTPAAHAYEELLKSLSPKGVNFHYIDDPAAPEISVSADFGTWNGSGTVTAKVEGADAQLSNFRELMLNGKAVSTGNYTLKSGSTIITLHEDYLNSFANGKYTFEAAFDSGYAPLTLVIEKVVENPQSGSPQTGDTSQIVLMLTLVLSSATLLILVQKKRKKVK